MVLTKQLLQNRVIVISVLFEFFDEILVRLDLILLPV